MTWHYISRDESGTGPLPYPVRCPMLASRCPSRVRFAVDGRELSQLARISARPDTIGRPDPRTLPLVLPIDVLLPDTRSQSLVMPMESLDDVVRVMLSWNPMSRAPLPRASIQPRVSVAGATLSMFPTFSHSYFSVLQRGWEYQCQSHFY